MRQFLSIISIVLFFSGIGRAQDQITLLYSDHFQLNASRVMPSVLGNDDSKMQLSLGYFDVWLANNSISRGDILHQRSSNDLLDAIEANLDERNRFNSGQDLQSIALSFKISAKEKEKITVGFGVTDKLVMDLLISKNFFKLIWNGNKQFAGDTVDLGPLKYNAHYNREYFLAMALPLKNEDNLHWRLGWRMKYLEGISDIYMPGVQGGRMFTQEEGKYIEGFPDVEIFTAGVSKDFSPFAFHGHGFGFDIASSVYKKFNQNKIGLSVAILDMGKMYYISSTRQITSKKRFLYEGQVIDAFFGGKIDFVGDSIAEVLNSEVKEGIDYDHKLSTRIVVNLEFRTTQLRKNGEVHDDANAFFLTYVQGFHNSTRSTTDPYVALGYSFNLFDIWNLGGSVGYGGYNRFTIGAFTSIGVKYFRIGVGSSNLAGLIYKEQGTGVNLNANLMFGF